MNVAGKRYNEMDQDYRDKFSRDEFTGQKEHKQFKRYKRGRLAGDKIASQPSHSGNPLEEGKKFYREGEDGTRQYQDLTAEDNPFNVKSLDEFDLAAYGRGSQRNQGIMNVMDVRGLKKMGGFDQQEIADYVTENDIRVSKHARNKLGLNMGSGGRNDPKDPVDEGGGGGGGSKTPPPQIDPEKPKPDPVGPIISKPSSLVQNQQVTQDNDITNTIKGNNNVVSNVVDNSVSQMGNIGGNYAQRYANGLKDQYILNLLGR